MRVWCQFAIYNYCTSYNGVRSSSLALSYLNRMFLHLLPVYVKYLTGGSTLKSRRIWSLSTPLKYMNLLIAWNRSTSFYSIKENRVFIAPYEM